MVLGWLAEYADAAEGVTNFLNSATLRAPIIRAGLDAGMSGAAILRDMRAAGISMRTQNFYGLVRQIREGGQGYQSLLGGVTGSTFPAKDITQLQGGTAGTYMVNVRTYYTLRDENGDIETGFRITSVLQSGELDVDAAMAKAQDIWNNAAPEGYQLGTITAQEISSVSQWQGK